MESCPNTKDRVDRRVQRNQLFTNGKPLPHLNHVVIIQTMKEIKIPNLSILTQIMMFYSCMCAVLKGMYFIILFGAHNKP